MSFLTKRHSIKTIFLQPLHQNYPRKIRTPRGGLSTNNWSCTRITPCATTGTRSKSLLPEKDDESPPFSLLPRCSLCDLWFFGYAKEHDGEYYVNTHQLNRNCISCPWEKHRRSCLSLTRRCSDGRLGVEGSRHLYRPQIGR
jgi:hypothetical protein